jgi:hypothetical protein
MFSDLPHGALLEPGRARLLAASLLQAFSLLLGHLASRLLPAEQGHASPPVLEFHADAGAAEGLLYADGQLVGRIAGVKRL